MNRVGAVREPLVSYLTRKFTDFFLAGSILAILAAVDVEALRSSAPYPIGTFLFINTVLLIVFVGLAARGWMKWGRRRYAIDGANVILPVGGPTVPDWIPVSDIVGVTVTPLAPPRQGVPSFVRMVIVSNDTSPGREGKVAEIEVAAGADAFGLRNLQDLLVRLPPEKLDPSFARPWQARLLAERGLRTAD